MKNIVSFLTSLDQSGLRRALWFMRRQDCAQVLWQWHRAGCPEERWTYVAIDSPHEQYRWEPGSTHETEGDPREFHGVCRDAYSRATRPDWRRYVQLTPESIYYDDVTKRIRRAARDHNRVAVVIQGLLDRSTCLHPHPPWRLWTADGFAAGVDLVYDVSRAIAPGEAPDFEAYRRQLNKSLRVGCHTIGQRPAWIDAMKERNSYKWHPSRYDREGEGPDWIDVVHKIWRDGSLTYHFVRDRARPKWVPNPERPGYLKASYPDIEMKWRCSADAIVMCVDAYTPGDFHLFFDDPRTRADYLQWAPYLLAAEDWHHERRQAAANATATKATKADPPRRKRNKRS